MEEERKAKLRMNGWPGEVRVEGDVVLAQDQAESALGKPVKHVIFDFGNVLVYWKAELALVPRYSPEMIREMLDNTRSGFFDANNMMDGGASCLEAEEWVGEHYGSPWREMFTFYCENFIDSLAGPVPGARVLVHDLKAAGIGVWGLSNWATELFPFAWDQYPVLHDLDDFVVSGPIHMRKPHADIYRYALERFDIQAQDALFVDDKGMNVAGANKVGIRSVRFTDPYKLRTLLITAGIDIPQVE